MRASRWRIEALQRFPELSADINEAESPYQLWHSLLFAFQAAYDNDRQETIKRIYQYAWWCCEQPEGKTADDDLGTCVTVCFFEHIPEHPKALTDMPRWWSLQQVTRMKEVFSYMVGPSGYAQVLAQYAAQQQVQGPTSPPSAEPRP